MAGPRASAGGGEMQFPEVPLLLPNPPPLPEDKGRRRSTPKYPQAQSTPRSVFPQLFHLKDQVAEAQEM